MFDVIRLTRQGGRRIGVCMRFGKILRLVSDDVGYA